MRSFRILPGLRTGENVLVQNTLLEFHIAIDYTDNRVLKVILSAN